MVKVLRLALSELIKRIDTRQIEREVNHGRSEGWTEHEHSDQQR